MATIQPKGENLRQAVRWISERRGEETKATIPTLIGEASLRFNLSPKDEEFLVNFYRAGGAGQI